MRGRYWRIGTIPRTDSLRTDGALIFIPPSFQAISVSIFIPGNIPTAETGSGKRPIDATQQYVSDLTTSVQTPEYRRVWHTVRIHRGRSRLSLLTIKAYLEASWMTLIKDFGAFLSAVCLAVLVNTPTVCVPQSTHDTLEAKHLPWLHRFKLRTSVHRVSTAGLEHFVRLGAVQQAVRMNWNRSETYKIVNYPYAKTAVNVASREIRANPERTPSTIKLQRRHTVCLPRKYRLCRCFAPVHLFLSATYA